VFKDEVLPMEEDKDNVGGGRVVLKMDLANAGVPEGMAMGEAYRVWTHAVLGCIGASVEPYSIITRVRMVKKVTAIRCAATSWKPSTPKWRASRVCASLCAPP